MELRSYLHFLRNSWEWVAVFTLTGITVAMAAVLSTTPKFTATSELFLATPGYSATGSLASYESSPYQADVFAQQRARSYVQLASRVDLARRALDKLGLSMRPEELANATSASVRPDTVLIEVTVKANSPTKAKALADAVAAELANDIRSLEMPSAVVIPTVDPVTTQSASLPRKPSEPNIAIYLTLGAALGFLVGVTAARWLAHKRVVDPAVIEQSTSRPVLGEIRSGPVQVDLVGDGKRSESEALDRHWRKIYRNVTFEMEDTSDRVIAVTNVNAVEAASAPTVALACAFARNGSRTALVATDATGVDYLVTRDLSVVGLAGVIAGESRLQDAIQPTEVANLYYLAGPGPENLTPLLHSEKFRRIGDELRESFDTVIFDAPGFLQQAESTLLPEIVDSVILIVVDKTTQTRDLSSAVRLLRNCNTRIMGTIVMSIFRDNHIHRPPQSLIASGRGLGE